MSDTGQREPLEVGDYGRLPLEQVLGMVDNGLNPVRALWDGADLQGEDAKTMADAIVAAGGVVEPIVAYRDGHLRSGHRRIRGMARLLMYPKEHGIDAGAEGAFDGLTAQLIVVAHGEELEDIKAEILANGSQYEPVDYIVAYRLLTAKGMHQLAVGKLLGHQQMQAKLYAALAESAGPKLLEAIKAGRVAVSTLRTLSELPANERGRWLDVAAEVGAAVAMMRREEEHARASSPDGEVPPEVAEKIERAQRKLQEDESAGRPADTAARNTQAILGKGLEEAPWSLARLMQTLTTLATPENMICYTLLGILQGWTAEGDQAKFWASLGEIMSDGSKAATAKGRILGLCDYIVKAKKKAAEKGKVSFVRPGRVARKAGAEKAAKPAKNAKEAAPKKGNGKAAGAKVAKGEASGAAKKAASKKAPAESVAVG